MDDVNLLELIEHVEALCMQESWAQALIESEEIIKRWPTDPMAFYIRGRARWGNKDYTGALEDLDAALLKDPKFPKAHHYRGNVLSDLKRYEEALVCYNSALQIDPQYANAQNGKGNALRALRRLEEALVCYNSALQIDPQFAYALNGKGNALSGLKRYEEALVCYNSAFQIDPQYTYALNGKGNVLFGLKRYEEALDCYNRALLVDPQYSNALNGKGNVLSDLKRYEEALDCYNSAIKINPEEFYYLNRALLFEELHQTGNAILDYRKCLELDPSFAAARIRLDRLVASPEDASGQGEAPISSLNDVRSSNNKVENALRRFLDSIDQANKWPKEDAEAPWTIPHERIRHLHSHLNCSKIFADSEEKKNSFKQFTTSQTMPDTGEIEFFGLRRWNSYTPIIDSQGTHSRGGGYYLSLGKDGIVIDPGFDFIENFMEAGFKFSHISKVFVTHAHNDHDADLESILTLLYIYNKDAKNEIDKNLGKELTADNMPALASMSEEEIYQYLVQEKGKRYQEQRKTIDLYLSASAFKKHASQLNMSRKSDYRVHVVDPHYQPILCEKGIAVSVIPAKHYDLISDCDAIGFIFETATYALVYTGDTGFTPSIAAAYRKIRRSRSFF